MYIVIPNEYIFHNICDIVKSPRKKNIPDIIAYEKGIKFHRKVEILVKDEQKKNIQS